MSPRDLDPAVADQSTDGGISRGRRLFAGADARLVPQARLSGPMPWVIAIMVALTAIALSAGLALGNAVSSAKAELEGGITVQIVEPRQDVRKAEAAKAVKALGELPGIAGLRLVPDAELDKLIEPWLGDALGKSRASKDDVSVPIPALIDVRLAGPVNAESMASIAEALKQVAPSARVDAQSTWLKPVFDAIVSLQWLAGALVVLLGVALTAAVLLAARSALGANRDTIEIVHLLGGTDVQIARVFQRSIGIHAAGGGVLGLILAIFVIRFLGGRFANLGAGMVDSGALGWSDWLLLALVPLVATGLAIVTARFTVLHALRKML